MLSFTPNDWTIFLFDQSKWEFVRSHQHYRFDIIKMGTKEVPKNANIQIDEKLSCKMECHSWLNNWIMGCTTNTRETWLFIIVEFKFILDGMRSTILIQYLKKWNHKRTHICMFCGFKIFPTPFVALISLTGNTRGMHSVLIGFWGEVTV
jgi:hypothetical protein